MGPQMVFKFFRGSSDFDFEMTCDIFFRLILKSRRKLMLSNKFCDWTPESIATLPPFGPIEGQKWFDQISSQ